MHAILRGTRRSSTTESPEINGVSRPRTLKNTVSSARVFRGRAFATSANGYTFVELVVVSAIIVILASAVMPLARVTVTRQREAELRRALREIRTAVDKYKDAADTGVIGSLEIKVGSEGYPPDLETLVVGVAAANDATGRKLKYLRRVPIDPMTHGTDWGLRSYQDKPDSTTWGGQNVFDVYTTFNGTALDGTKYKDW
jgi:general secretion pathway protein G